MSGEVNGREDLLGAAALRDYCGLGSDGESPGLGRDPDAETVRKFIQGLGRWRELGVRIAFLFVARVLSRLLPLWEASAHGEDGPRDCLAAVEAWSTGAEDDLRGVMRSVMRAVIGLPATASREARIVGMCCHHLCEPLVESASVEVMLLYLEGFEIWNLPQLERSSIPKSALEAARSILGADESGHE